MDPKFLVRKRVTVCTLLLLTLLSWLFGSWAARAQNEPFATDAVSAALGSDAEAAPRPAGEVGRAPASQAGEQTAGSGKPPQSTEAVEAGPEPPLRSCQTWLQWFWNLGGGPKKPALPRATIIALALLLAFLTVAEIWQIPAPSTSLTQPSRAAKETETDKGQPEQPRAAAVSSNRIGNLFDSNFSRTVLSGLGGLAAVSFIGRAGEADSPGFSSEAYYFILFVVFFLTGLVASAVMRGVGEALRSRITLNRPAVLWPQLEGEHRLRQWLRYRLRQLWYWLASFRATAVVFVDTMFNVLMGKNQLQSAIFSETITDLHESLLEAAERTREEVHRAVIRALLAKGALPPNLPQDERVRVAISLLSSDRNSVYYIAWERGCIPQRFDQHSVAWICAFTGEARWYRSDPPKTPQAEQTLNPAYRNAVIFENTEGEIPGPAAPLPLTQYYQPRDPEDYEAFLVLPLPWTNRGRSAEHRRGALHISFEKSAYMEQLWEHLESEDGRPNYEGWKGLLRTEPEDGSVALNDLPELGAVLHQALEVLGRALSHFDDEVYEVYVRARRHSTEIPL